MCDKIRTIRAASLVEPPIGRLPDAVLRRMQAVVNDLIDEGVSLD